MNKELKLIIIQTIVLILFMVSLFVGKVLYEEYKPTKQSAPLSESKKLLMEVK